MIIKNRHYDIGEYVVNDFNGTEHTVDYLSKEELQQTVCQLIEYIEALNVLNRQSKSLIKEWRKKASIKKSKE